MSDQRNGLKVDAPFFMIILRVKDTKDSIKSQNNTNGHSEIMFFSKFASLSHSQWTMISFLNILFPIRILI